ncbi:MAG: peptide deformylase [Sulfurimonas sp.]|jgi:peptide deformylase|nr:peptide deformylase [Sulfurimonadaceae bacterium]
MDLEIVEYPDKSLRRVCSEVECFDGSLHRLLDAMYIKMLQSNGIGLAAIQVNHPIRALIINIPDEDGVQDEKDLLEIINPRIVFKDGTITYQEGCLSVPNFYEDIERFDKVILEYQNRDAELKTLEADGLLSVAIQHELDHLNGVLFIDKLSYSRRKKFEKEYKKAQKAKKQEK